MAKQIQLIPRSNKVTLTPRKVETRSTSRKLLDEFVGTGEAIAAVGSGITTFLGGAVSGTAGIAKLAQTGDFDKASKTIEEYQKAMAPYLQFEPKTKRGKEKQETVAKFFDFLIGRPSREFGKLASKGGTALGGPDVGAAAGAITQTGLELAGFSALFGVLKSPLPSKTKLETGQKLNAKDVKEFEKHLADTEVFTKAQALKNNEILDALRRRGSVSPEATAYIQALTNKERIQLFKDLRKKDRPQTVSESSEELGAPQLTATKEVKLLPRGEEAKALPRGALVTKGKVEPKPAIATAVPTERIGNVIRPRKGVIEEAPVETGQLALPSGDRLALPETASDRSSGGLITRGTVKPIILPVPKTQEGNRIAPRAGVFGDLVETIDEVHAPIEFYNEAQSILAEASTPEEVAKEIGVTYDGEKFPGIFSFTDNARISFSSKSLDEVLDNYNKALDNFIKDGTPEQIKTAKANKATLKKFEGVDVIEDTSALDAAIARTKAEDTADTEVVDNKVSVTAPKEAIFPELAKEKKAPVTNLRLLPVDKGLYSVRYEGQVYLITKPEGSKSWGARVSPEVTDAVQKTPLIVKGHKTRKSAVEALVDIIKLAKETAKDVLGNEGGFINFFKVRNPKKKYSNKNIIHPTTRQPMYVMFKNKWMPEWYEFWDPLSTLPHSNDLLMARYRQFGDIERADRTVKKVVALLNQFELEVRKDIYSFLDGTLNLEDIPVGAQKTAATIQRLQQKIGLALVKHEVLDRETYEANKTNYVPYMYTRYIIGDGEIMMSSSGKVDIPYTIARNPNITDVQKEALGLIRDAGVVVPLGIGRALIDLGKLDYMKTISTNPDWTWLPSIVEVEGEGNMGIGRLADEVKAVSRQVAIAPNPAVEARLNRLQDALEKAKEGTQNKPEGYTLIPSSFSYGPLAGAYIRTPIANDMLPLWSSSMGKGSGKIVQRLKKAEAQSMALFKMSKVALNPPTAIRNVVSNIVQNNLRGRALIHLPNDYRLAIEATIRGNRSQYLREARRHGLFKTNWASAELNELLEIFKSIDANNWDSFMLAITKIAKYYGKIDDISKLAIFIQMRRDGHSISESVLEAQKWGMDYSLASRSIKETRRHVVPFVSYQYKAAPLLVESIRRNPLIIGKYLAFVKWGIPLAVKVALDMSEEDYQEMEKDLPNHIRNAGTSAPLPYRDEEGRYKWTTFDNYFPWGNWLAIAKDVYNLNIGELTKDSGITNPPLSVFLAAKSAAGRPPVDPFSGIPIYSDLDAPHVKMGKTMEFIYNIWAPSFLTRQGALGHTLAIGKKDKWGKSTSAKEAAARWFGFNVFTIDPTQSDAIKTFKISELRRALRRDMDKLTRSGVTKTKRIEQEDSLISRFEKKVDDILEARD